MMLAALILGLRLGSVRVDAEREVVFSEWFSSQQIGGGALLFTQRSPIITSCKKGRPGFEVDACHAATPQRAVTTLEEISPASAR
jgi:hypothetical protein